jgi:hypothetical protein
MRLALIIATVMVMTALGIAPGRADKRVALVIGNSNYRHAGRLTNPVNDASAVAALLKTAGFVVVELRNDVDIAQMRRAISDFADTVRDSDVAIVYYAGHGMEVDGVNYLIPVDATLARDFDVEDETISLDRVLKAIDSARRLRLVILDACRVNPFIESMKRSTRAIARGFAQVEPTTPNTLVAFAAKAGTVAFDGGSEEHSPFTAALLKSITKPGLDVRLALGEVRDAVMATTSPQQEPFVYGSLGGRTISIVDSPPTGSSQPNTGEQIPSDLAGGQPQPSGPSRVDAAEHTWAVIQGTSSVAVLKDFIRQFGATTYGSLARARLAELEAQLAAITPVSPPIGADVGESAPPISECLQLWLRRNQIFKDRRYCFKTRAAIDYFGNAGCVYNNEDSILITTLERSTILQIAARERALRCQIDTSRPIQALGVARPIRGSQ